MTWASWLWPDRIIRKRESRALRDEHNRLVDAHARLHDAAKAVLAEWDANWTGTFDNDRLTRAMNTLENRVTNNING